MSGSLWLLQAGKACHCIPACIHHPSGVQVPGCTQSSAHLLQRFGLHTQHNPHLGPGTLFCCFAHLHHVCLSCHCLLCRDEPPAAEHRQISDTEYKQFTDTIIDKLIDAERVTTLVLKDLATAAASAGNGSAALAAANAAALAAAMERAAAEEHQAGRRNGRGLALDENFVADAAAEELRERLKQLAKQVVDLQVGRRHTNQAHLLGNV